MGIMNILIADLLALFGEEKYGDDLDHINAKESIL